MSTPSSLDCGSGCRGFDTRHSPQITAETPGADFPLVPPGASGSAGYSPNIVQRPDLAEGLPAETGSATDAVSVPLGHGLFALVDARDAERVLAKTWHAWRKPGRPDVVYAQHTFRYKAASGAGRGKSGAIWLHSFVLELPPGQIADHRNGKGLDCRRDNLRAATKRQNSQNVTRSKNQRLGGFKGVAKQGGGWLATIRGGEVQTDGRRKQLRLGLFATAEEAARAYDRKALEAFGPFSSLNFPDPEAEQFAIAMGEAAERQGVDPTTRKRSTGAAS